MTASMAVVVDDVHKRFRLRHTHSLKESLVWLAQRRRLRDEFSALSGVGLEVRQGEAVALLGHNGSGKSTLLKLMAGVMSPDAGEVRVRGRVAGLLEVGAGLHPDLTGRENIFLNAAILGLERGGDPGPLRRDRRLRRHRPVPRRPGALLLLRDVPAPGVRGGRAHQPRRLPRRRDPRRGRRALPGASASSASACSRGEGRTLVIVSHDLDLVAGLCTRGVVLSGGRLVHDGAIEGAVSTLRATW